MTNTYETGGPLTRTVENAASGGHRAIEQASGLARPAVEQMAAGAHVALDRMAGAANQAAAALDMNAVKLRDTQQRMTESCRTYVREKPLASLGMAVAAGFVLSWLLSRR